VIFGEKEVKLGVHADICDYKAHFSSSKVCGSRKYSNVTLGRSFGRSSGLNPLPILTLWEIQFAFLAFSVPFMLLLL